ncbi:alpha/beta hydrolase [Pseudooceanicola sp. CBS1P-1]|uniref:alpha/beta hydrolase n=1 Tax=Pseudooceanicola endophyticus TaxID=2841273 RepID=UPI001C01CBA3|nr:alpha/beta hydrolase-fold protein [Pseudooceanicola endophyticus]MBT9384542.1 alpha/beta hydrolase [Pseudooceanicola endophyticus]
MPPHGYRTAEVPLPGTAAVRIVLRLLIPDQAPPPGGFPVLYALDGNAAFQDIDAPVRARCAEGPGAVLVALGAEEPARFARLERTRDYTPPDAAGAPVLDPHGRPAGGAAAFEALLPDLVARAEALAPVNPARRFLWGHSYGGLFVLRHALGQGPSPFAGAIAASPALWWDHQRFLTTLKAQLESGARPRIPVQFHTGGAEKARATRSLKPEARAFMEMRDALPETALPELACAFRRAGASDGMTVFPGLSHGETFSRSIRESWRALALDEGGFPGP